MSNEQKSPILPKKYLGVTPGEWCPATSHTGIVYVEADGIEIAGISHLADGKNNAMLDVQRKANSVLMADAPRLAAAVVELRDGLALAVRLVDEGVICIKGTDREQFLKALSKWNDTLESTKEWEA